jgi:hypothetical protein
MFFPIGRGFARGSVTFPVLADFPDIPASTAGRNQGQTSTADVTTHPITLPTGIQVGDLLLVWFGTDGQPTISVGTGTGWTLAQSSYGTNVHTACIAWKVATGSDTLSLLTSVGQQSSHLTWRITGTSVDQWLIDWDFSNGQSTNSNPPNHISSNGAQKYLFIAARAGDNVVNVTGYPTNYTQGQRLLTASATTGSSVAAAERELEAASDDPSTFTVATERWSCATISIAYTVVGDGDPGDTTPLFVAGSIDYDTVLQQNQSVATTLGGTFDLNDCFTGGGLSFSYPEGSLPTGVTESGGIISGTPTGFQGRRWITIRATNSINSVDYRFLMSVRPRTDVCPFDGQAWEHTFTGTSVPSAATLTNKDHILIINANYNNGITFNNCNNILVIDSDIIHTSDSRDCIRLEADVDDFAGWNLNMSGHRDGFKIAEDYPNIGSEIYLMNSYIFDCGNNSDPKEHGAYVHSHCYLIGNIWYRNMYGNAISTRSSAQIHCNFIYQALEAGVSKFDDHVEYGSLPWQVSGNVVVDVDGTGDYWLRNVTVSGNQVVSYSITNNYGTANNNLVEQGSGYTSPITITGNIELSEAAALAMFPALPWT